MAQQAFLVSSLASGRSFMYHLTHGSSRMRLQRLHLASIRCGGRAKPIFSSQLFQQRNFATDAKSISNSNAPMLPAKNLKDAFQSSTLYSDGRIYKLLRFERPSMDYALQVWKNLNTSSAPPFGCFMVDKDEITMMVDSDIYSEYCDTINTKHRVVVVDNGINYRLFTFDNVVMDPSLVGFMAAVTKALAENAISVLPYAAYSTDHVFVAESDADRTKTILEGLSND